MTDAFIKALDVSTYQNGLSPDLVWDAGYRAVYVKLGGDNLKPRYVAPHYNDEVDKYRAKGFIIGHYWIPGGDPIGAAHFFVDHLRHFDKAHDFLVLDNETLNAGAAFNDSQAHYFLTEVQKKTGVSKKQVFMYGSASFLRERAWPLTTAFGPQIIVAQYGVNDGTRHGDPDIGNVFGGKWAGHQYTSVGKIKGFAGDLDLDVFKSGALSFAASTPSKPAPAPAPKPTTTWNLAAVSKTLQEWARRGGYDGPIDGKLGINSWKGVQTLLKKSYGYAGPIDGKPGEHTYIALQHLAKKGGYTGPIDGEMGSHSWHGVAKALGQKGA